MYLVVVVVLWGSLLFYDRSLFGSHNRTGCFLRGGIEVDKEEQKKIKKILRDYVVHLGHRIYRVVHVEPYPVLSRFDMD